MLDHTLILITTASPDEANRIASALVDEKLIACANVVPAVHSHFIWKGKRTEETESLLIAKTRRKLFDAVAKRVRELHSYDVPEIIALPIVAGSADYLKWLDESTREPEG